MDEAFSSLDDIHAIEKCKESRKNYPQSLIFHLFVECQIGKFRHTKKTTTRGRGLLA